MVLGPVRPETDVSIMFDPSEDFYLVRQIEVFESLCEVVFSVL